MHDKAIQHGKEHRKQYTGAKLCDRTCRNHGSCTQCQGNRTFSYKRKNWWSKQEAKECCEWQDLDSIDFLYDSKSHTQPD